MRLGRQGSFDSRMLYMGRGMLALRDELWMYYSGYDHLHDLGEVENYRSAIGRVRIRRDGFASQDVLGSGGTLTTHPFNLTGRSLEVNMDASSRGWLNVEILDQEEQPFPGFNEETADRLHGNDVHQRVTWNGQDDCTSLFGRSIRLRFVGQSVKLYAFQFLESETLERTRTAGRIWPLQKEQRNSLRESLTSVRRRSMPSFRATSRTKPRRSIRRNSGRIWASRAPGRCSSAPLLPRSTRSAPSTLTAIWKRWSGASRTATTLLRVPRHREADSEHAANEVSRAGGWPGEGPLKARDSRLLSCSRSRDLGSPRVGPLAESKSHLTGRGVAPHALGD